MSENPIAWSFNNTPVDSRVKKSIIIRLTASGLMIIAGAAIYLTSRSDIIFLDWIPQPIVKILRHYSFDDTSALGRFAIYSLPDGLWYGSLLIYQSSFVYRSKASKSIFRFSIALPFILEILQIHEIVPGTFDPLDLLAYLITLTIFMFFTIRHHGEK